jgi:uncharacterized protein (TIGR04222 family)
MSSGIVYGAVFWLLLTAALALAVRARVRVNRMKRSTDPAGLHRQLSTEETAYLMGGPVRVADVLMVRLHAEGRIQVRNATWITAEGFIPQNPLEEALLTTLTKAKRPAPPALLRLHLFRKPAMREIHGRLADYGLLMPFAVERRLSRGVVWLILPLGIVAPLAMRAGSVPVAAFLAILLPAFLLPHATVIKAHTRRTATGEARVRALRSSSVPRPTVPGVDDPFLLTAVAVTGPGAVLDPYLHSAMTPTASASGSSSSSSTTYACSSSTCSSSSCSSSSCGGGGSSCSSSSS